MREECVILDLHSEVSLRKPPKNISLWALRLVRYPIQCFKRAAADAVYAGVGVPQIYLVECVEDIGAEGKIGTLGQAQSF